MDNQVEREFGWDDSIEKDAEFILLEAGEYDFRVESFERARYAGGNNIPACPQAILTLSITTPNGLVKLTHSLFLHSKTEWALSSFFTSIGQKKKGEVLKMNWNTVPGSTGRCKIIQEEYKGELYNKIKRFLPPKEPAYTPGEF